MLLTKRFRLHLLLILGGLLTAILVLELVLSAVSYFVYPRLTVSDALLGWKYRHTESGKTRHYFHHVAYRLWINEDGFRDEPFSAGGRAPRVMVLGDSMTFGMEVDQEKIWPYRLEEMLRRDPGLKDLDVMNFGITGFSTAQELLTLREYGAKYRPRAVLLLLNETNDFEDNLGRFRYGRFQPHFELADGKLILHSRPTALEKTLTWLRDKSVLYFLVYRAVDIVMRSRCFPGSVPQSVREELMLRLLSEMNDFSKREGMFFGIFYIRSSQYSGERVKSVKEFCDHEKIPFAEIPVEIPGGIGVAEHWNETGHREVAGRIWNHLIKEPSFLKRIA